MKILESVVDNDVEWFLSLSSFVSSLVEGGFDDFCKGFSVSDLFFIISSPAGDWFPVVIVVSLGSF